MGAGEWASVGAAFCWACSSIIFGRAKLNAATINFTKNSFGTVLVFGHLLFLCHGLGTGFLRFGFQTWGYLALSGLIGIAIGDTFYFRSLQILGPRRALVMATTSPIFGAVLGFLILGEDVSFFIALGIVTTIAGIGVVIMDKRSRSESPGHFPGSEWSGVVCGLMAACCQAAGGAISKLGMQDCSPLEATFVRLLAATVCGVTFFAITRRLKPTIQSLCDWRTIGKLLPAVCLGTWLGIWCSQIGFLKSPIAVATVLMSTSPLIAIPLVRIFDKHRVSAHAIWGTVVALVGIAITLQGKQPAPKIKSNEMPNTAESIESSSTHNQVTG